MRSFEGVQPFFSQEHANTSLELSGPGASIGGLGQPAFTASNQRRSWRTLGIFDVLAVLGDGLMSGIRRLSLLSRTA